MEIITYPHCAKFLSGIPKGQYKGYTCPQCQKTKVSAQHHRQKEKKKRTGSSSQEKGVNGKGSQPAADVPPKPVSILKKQPILNPQGLLEAILADCSADPSNFHPLKNSFKKLLQIQRAFKVPALLRTATHVADVSTKTKRRFPRGAAERGGRAGPVLETFRLQVRDCPSARLAHGAPATRPLQAA